MEVLNWEAQTLRAFSNLDVVYTNPSTILNIEAGPSSYVETRSLVSVDCNSYSEATNDLSLSPVTPDHDPVNVGTIRDSAIFKRRLHRTPRYSNKFSTHSKRSYNYVCGNLVVNVLNILVLHTLTCTRIERYHLLSMLKTNARAELQIFWINSKII